MSVLEGERGGPGKQGLDIFGSGLAINVIGGGKER